MHLGFRLRFLNELEITFFTNRDPIFRWGSYHLGVFIANATVYVEHGVVSEFVRLLTTI